MTMRNAIGTARQAVGSPVPVAAGPDISGEAPAQAPQWVMIARTGMWLGHPSRPEIITPEHLHSALDYFDRHYAAHGTDLVVDYHHASVAAPRGAVRAPAAGWVREMELRADGSELWGRVLWTAEAASAVAQRQYRCLSPLLQFNFPDRVTADPVLMMVHSVGLTNTPFLTELETLNSNGLSVAECSEAVAMEGGGTTEARRSRRAAPVGVAGAGGEASTEGGESMSVLDSLAQALAKEPEQVASGLGLELPAGASAEVGSAEGRRVAEVIMANAVRVKELEAELVARAPVVAEEIANALGVPADADPTAVKAAIIRLKVPAAGLEAIRRKLGLGRDAQEAEVLNAIEALQQTRRRSEAEQLVDEGVSAGKIPPAHREFYLNEAINDLDAAREVINAMPVMTQPRRGPRTIEGPQLTDAEQAVCRQLGLSAATFLNAAD